MGSTHDHLRLRGQVRLSSGETMGLAKYTGIYTPEQSEVYARCLTAAIRDRPDRPAKQDQDTALAALQAQDDHQEHQVQQVTSTTSTSRKRPLPTGLIPKEKKKKLAADSQEPVAIWPKSARVTSASRSSQV